MTHVPEATPQAFTYTERQKTKFFAQLAARTASGFKEHAREGLWNRNEQGERDWGNMSEHCLVEVARVSVLADLVGLPAGLKKELEVGAGLHDIYKKRQKEFAINNGLSFDSFEQAAIESHRALTQLGFNDRIVGIAGAVGHESIPDIMPILGTKELSELDTAKLIMHYVDDYTNNSEWVQETIDKDGRKYNDLDRRMDGNEANERYKILNEEGRVRFNGETSYQAQRRVGHMVEERLTKLIKKSTGKTMDSIDLPSIIDSEIKFRISKV